MPDQPHQDDDMRQDKDRSGKWLLSHHGSSVLTLGGLGGFSFWRAAQPETVAPRRCPDGLLEVRYPGQTESEWVLVEIETYPGRDVDRQVFDDLPLVLLDKGVLPEVICLVLRPRGKVEVRGTAERVSRRKTARLSASWKVVRLWELRAEDLLASGDVGLVPWVPLTQSDDPPEVVLRRCRQRIDQVADASDRAGLLAVTQILAGLAYSDRRLLDLLGGPQVMIDSPVLDEVCELIRSKAEAEFLAKGRLQTLRSVVVDALTARFSQVPMDQLAALAQLTDEAKLKVLFRVAVTCPTIDAFLVSLNEPKT